jgi:PAS domain-containing protein
MIQEADRSAEIELMGRHFEIRAQLFRDSKRSTAGGVVSFVELTELRRALAGARLKEQQIMAVTENTPALITMNTYANSRFCKAAGHALSEIIGRTDEELFGVQQGWHHPCPRLRHLKEPPAQRGRGRAGAAHRDAAGLLLVAAARRAGAHHRADSRGTRSSQIFTPRC